MEQEETPKGCMNWKFWAVPYLPYYHPKYVLPIFVVIGMLCTLGGVLLLNVQGIEQFVEYGMRDADGVESDLNKIITVDIEIAETMTKPVFLYYYIDGMFQNHKKYVNSYSKRQVRQFVDFNNADIAMMDVGGTSVIDLDATFPNVAKPKHCIGANLAYSDPEKTIQLMPCGIVPQTLFNDSFRIGLAPAGTGDDYAEKQLDESATRIAIHYDVTGTLAGAGAYRNLPSKLKDHPLIDPWINGVLAPQRCNRPFPTTIEDTRTTAEKRPIVVKSTRRGHITSVPCATQRMDDDTSDDKDCEFVFAGSQDDANEWGKPADCSDPEGFGSPPGAIVDTPSGWGMASAHFMNWMRPSGLSPFKKLWAVLDEDLPAGTKVRMMITNVYPTEPYQGRKAFILATTSWMGTPSDTLAIVYLVIGCASLITAFIGAHLYHAHNKEWLKDMENLDCKIWQ